ncbi:MAG TPA: twin-arginine translocase subunit TatC [Crocinitomicaceae bacterium]|nr:twin-arginine translocase subunit TatC [Crocinitomicaceae bacterium]
MEENKEMNFFDHLEELRKRIVWSAIAVVSMAVVIFIYQEWIMDNIFLNLKNPDFITYRLFCQYLGVCVTEIPVEMHSNNMGGQFGYSMMMSFVGAAIVVAPFIFYQLWAFVKPGLKKNEIQVFKGIVFYISLLFFIGIAFGYFVVAPLTVQFFGSYQISKQIVNFFTISSYMSTIISTVFYSGLFFLLPVVLYVASKLGIITAAFLKKYRRHAIMVVLILAAVITPPDVISQIIVSIPILLLYEIGVLVVVRTEKDQLKKAR